MRTGTSERRPAGADREAGQDLALKLWIVLSRASAAVEAHARAHAALHDLTIGEFGVLELLYHKGPTLLGEIQRRRLVSSGGITYLVDRLAARGLVERRACPEDRRACYAALTGQGEALIQRIFPEHVTALERALSGLTEEEKREAVDLLKRLGHRAADLQRPGTVRP